MYLFLCHPPDISLHAPPPLKDHPYISDRNKFSSLYKSWSALSSLLRSSVIVVVFLQLAMVPGTDGMPVFHGETLEDLRERMKEEFERLNCREQQLAVTRPDLPDICKQYIFSISAVMQGKALGQQLIKSVSK